MDNNVINKIQKRILELLPPDKRDQPGVLLEDSCSELSRLVADWIKAQDPSSQILVLKGDNVCGTDKSHDILQVVAGGQVNIVDPTVWQFFPQEKSILVFTEDGTDKALEKVEVKYGGKWSVSEKFAGLKEVEKREYLDIVSQNIIETLKES